MSRPFLSALVLAAGSSRRFGQPKQLLPYHGTTLLGWVARQAEASADLDEVLVVLGHAADGILPSLALTRARSVVAAEYAEGCAASYRAGLAAVSPCAHAVMILLGDQPGAGAEEIGRIAASWRAEGGAIVAARYQGAPGHPLIFSRRLFPELAELHGDKAAWKLLDQHPGLVRLVELGRPLPPDIDTPADYTAVARSAPESSGGSRPAAEGAAAPPSPPHEA
ncbi:MAG TPA: nucleotidyltransferase family protein [Ktedonobacterales bacterium]